MSEPPLSVEGLAHAYGGAGVLRDVSFTLSAGELLAVLGPSGCGKTTLLRSVAGLVTPAQGVIRVGGREVVREGRELVPIERRHVGLVFQDYALFPFQSVRENVGFGLTPPEPARVAELLELVGLGELGARKPAELSGGQQQRVALARALAPRPHLLLLDEPFANVDAFRRAQLGVELRRVLRETQTAALMVTHDQSDALRHADRLAVLSGPAGQAATLAQLDSAEAVYRAPASRAVARLVGEASFVEATAAGARAECAALGAVSLRAPAEGPVDLVLRPEDLRFEAREGGSWTVVGSAYLGRGHRVLVEREGASPVQVDGEDAPPGARGELHVRGPLASVPRASSPPAAR